MRLSGSPCSQSCRRWMPSKACRYSTREWATTSGAMSMKIAPMIATKPSSVIAAATPDGTFLRRIHVAIGASTVQMISASTIGKMPAQNAPMTCAAAYRNTAMMSIRSANIAVDFTHSLSTTPRSTRSPWSSAAPRITCLSSASFVVVLTRTIVHYGHLLCDDCFPNHLHDRDLPWARIAQREPYSWNCRSAQRW